MAALRSLAVVAVALAYSQVCSASCVCDGFPGGYSAGAALVNPLAGTFGAGLPYGGDLSYGSGSFSPLGLGGLAGGLGYDGYSGAGYGFGNGYGSFFPGNYGGLEEGCCPGPVIEKKSVITKAATVPFAFSIPTFSKKCFQDVNVDRKVIPSATAALNCANQITRIKVPTKEIAIQQTPLCKKTCTTSEYVIQIPIIETTCTSAPLCKKTVRAQDNVLTTVAAKTSCAKTACTAKNVVETPIFKTVCQDFAGAINKVGAKTVLKPEVVKSCVQLPPYKCLKPATGCGTSVIPYGADFGASSLGFLGASGLPFPGYGYGSDAFLGGSFPGSYGAPGFPYGAGYGSFPGSPSCACACSS